MTNDVNTMKDKLYEIDLHISQLYNKYGFKDNNKDSDKQNVEDEESNDALASSAYNSDWKVGDIFVSSRDNYSKYMLTTINLEKRKAKLKNVDYEDANEVEYSFREIELRFKKLRKS